MTVRLCATAMRSPRRLPAYLCRVLAEKAANRWGYGPYGPGP